MKKIKNKKILFLSVILVLALNFCFVFAQEKGWDSRKADMESYPWEGELNKWDKLAEEWYTKIKNAHSKYEHENNNFKGIQRRKYCNDLGCWEQDLVRYIFTGKDSIEKWSLSDDRTDANVVYGDGSSWHNSNDGTYVKFKSNNDEWESSGMGQIIVYINAKGDKWEHINQSIKFIGSNGEKWESHHYGGIIRHQDADGNIWEGSEDDDIDDMD
jgi:hypothetical protein